MFRILKQKYTALPLSLRATLWFFICAFLQKGATAIITPLLSRLLSTSEYGQYTVFNSWMDIAAIFVTCKLSAGVYTQGLVKFEKDRKVFSSSLQGLSLTLVLLWTGVYLLFQNFWNQLLSLSTAQMIAMIGMIWATNAFTFWMEEKRVDLRYRSLVLITLLVSVAKPVFGVMALAVSEDRVTGWIYGLLIAELIGYIGPFLSQMKRGRRFFSAQFWKYALWFNIPLIPHYLSQTVLNSSDRIMIERLVGTSEAGIYGLAYTLAHLMTLFSTALNQTIGPFLYRKIKDRKVEEISRVAYPALIAIAAVNLLLIATAPEVIAIVAPASYQDAMWVIPPVAMSVFLLFAYTFFANFEFYFEKTKYIAAATMGGAVLNIVLNAAFIPVFGYIAAGYTTLVCYFVYTAFHYCSMRIICREHLDNVRVYNTRILLIITFVFFAGAFVCMATYRFWILRYGMILAGFILCLIKRKEIFRIIQLLLRPRK